MSLPLDPTPWLHEHMVELGLGYGVRFERRADGGIDNAIWSPREGYEQDVERYQ